ncbi:RICIN domain-containing protein, partial [Streptomyces zhihengii]
GKCVDVAAANTADGTPIQLHDCNGNAAQKWTWTPLPANSSAWSPGTRRRQRTCCAAWDVNSTRTRERSASTGSR